MNIAEGSSYKSKSRPKFRVYDKDTNSWTHSSLERYSSNGISPLLTLEGELFIRTSHGTFHESSFPNRYLLFMENDSEERSEKVQVPRYVADLIEAGRGVDGEGTRANEIVSILVRYYQQLLDKESQEWLNVPENVLTLCSAIINGYEVIIEAVEDESNVHLTKAQMIVLYWLQEQEEEHIVKPSTLFYQLTSRNSIITTDEVLEAFESLTNEEELELFKVYAEWSLNKTN